MHASICLVLAIRRRRATSPVLGSRPPRNKTHIQDHHGANKRLFDILDQSSKQYIYILLLSHIIIRTYVLVLYWQTNGKTSEIINIGTKGSIVVWYHLKAPYVSYHMIYLLNEISMLKVVPKHQKKWFACSLLFFCIFKYIMADF